MASYSLILNKQVRKKDLPKVPIKTRRRIVDVIKKLPVNPRPPGVQRLTNREEYKLRSGNYRILYVIDDTKKMIEVRAIRHRGKAYKR